MAKLQENLLELFDTESGAESSSQARRLATFAITLNRYVHILIDELEQAEFSPIEVLAKSELFLKAVMPDFSKAKFDMMSEILLSADPRVEQSLFYHGLLSLRAMISNDIKVQHNAFEVFQRGTDTLMPLFAGYLAYIVAKDLTAIRKNIGNADVAVEQIKMIVDKNFDGFVFDAISVVSAVGNKLN